MPKISQDDEVVFKHVYEYGGIYYNITETSEVHEFLQSDSDYFVDYITKNVNTRSTDKTQNQDSDDCSFRWTSPATKLLLTMYLKLKRDFHNPGVKKRPLWREIKQAFKSQGFETISESTLDRKIRNIKRRYKTILLQNNRNKSSRRSSVKWEFFDLCEKIFGKHLLFPKNSSFENLPLSKSTSKRSQVPLELRAEDKDTSGDYWSEVLENSDSPEENALTNPTEEYLEDESEPFYLNQQWLEVQREKTDALNKIAQCMQENNEIQKERNDILRELLVNRNALNLENVEVGEILEGETQPVIQE